MKVFIKQINPIGNRKIDSLMHLNVKKYVISRLYKEALRSFKASYKFKIDSSL